MSNLIRLINEYDSIIKIAVAQCVPCYVAASIIGFTPSTYLTVLSEMAISNKNKDILDLLRTTDLKNFLIVLEDDDRTAGGALFKPLFQLPEVMADEIPTIKVSFDTGEFNLEQIDK